MGCGFDTQTWAVNSAEECFPDAEEVISSNLIRPTIKNTVIAGDRGPRKFYIKKPQL